MNSIQQDIKSPVKGEELSAFSREVHLHPGEIYVGQGPMTIRTLLGSCVAVCIWDKARKLGGMNHIMLPICRQGNEVSSKYGNVATFLLRDMLVERGGRLSHLEARIFGGARGLSQSGTGTGLAVGARNLEVTRAVLQRLGISILAEDVGGNRGRKLTFNLATGVIQMHYIHNYNFGREERTVTFKERRHDVWNEAYPHC